MKTSLGYYNVDTRKEIPWTQFRPLGRFLVDGIFNLTIGDHLISPIDDKEYEVVGRNILPSGYEEDGYYEGPDMMLTLLLKECKKGEEL